MKADLQDRVRARLRSLVAAGNVSHEILGKYVGLSRSFVTRIINADAAISLEHLAKFCEFFQITPAELLTDPSALIQPIKPLEAQLLRHFRNMSELQRHSLLMVLESRADETVKPNRRARLGRAELTTEQQLLVDLYAQSEPQAREGVLKVLRGTAKAREKADHANGRSE